MPWWRCFYHMMWGTRGRLALIEDEEEAIIRRSFQLTCDDLGMICHAVGFMPDHVHVAASIPPKIAVAEAIRRLKGASSHAVNERSVRRDEGQFGWQAEYGVVTFGQGTLTTVVEYVENQKKHHAERTALQLLERIDDE